MPAKSNEYGGIFVVMLRLCLAEVAKPLKLIFKHSLLIVVFTNYWKFANVQPIQKITVQYLCHPSVENLLKKLFTIPDIPT